MKMELRHIRVDSRNIYMLKYIDNFLNTITMYRLTLYYLICLILVAFVESIFHILDFNPIFFLLSIILVIAVSYITNIIFEKVFNAPTNVESVYITALILILLITPMKSYSDTAFFTLAISASILSMASKYILAIRKKHIFNPAAIAIVITSFTLGLYASWWVGTLAMLPFVLVGGLLIMRKTQNYALISSFLIVSLSIIVIHNFTGASSIFSTLERTLFYTPILFLAFVMLTEPLTLPPTKFLKICYGIMVGLLFPPFTHIGAIYFTPEIALSFSNIFSYIVSPKEKLMLILKQKIQITKDVYNFVFENSQKFTFLAGQYLEWTLAHTHSDARGNRRYFTIASSPTEKEVIIGVKFYEQSSSFKKSLLALPLGSVVGAVGLSGEFTLPKNTKRKLVFIAGGIGSTPFRSQIKCMLDTNEKRDISFLYSNSSEDDIAYKDIFDEGRDMLGIKMFYVITGNAHSPDSTILTGRINGGMIQKAIPDFTERYFYISGTHSFVMGTQTELLKIGILKHNIKIDFFPGFV